MRAVQLLAVAAAAALVAGVAYAVIAAVRYDGITLAFVLAAITGSYVAALLHHRNGATPPTAAVKALVGATLAATCVAVAAVLELAFHAFQYPEVQIPIAALGSFVFPFVLMKLPARALAQRDAAKNKRD